MPNALRNDTVPAPVFPAPQKLPKNETVITAKPATNTIIRSFVSGEPKMVCSIYQGKTPFSVTTPGEGEYRIPPFDPQGGSGIPYAYCFVWPCRDIRDLGDGKQTVDYVTSAAEHAEALFGATGASKNTYLDRGVFIPAGAVPTWEEIEGATQRFRAWLRTQIAIGDSAYSRRQDPRQVDDNSKLAAQLLGIDRDWATNAREDCPVCSKSIRPGIVKCPHCNAILDMKKAATYGLLSDAQTEAYKVATEG